MSKNRYRLTVAEFVEAWQNLKLDEDFASDLASISHEDSLPDNPWGSYSTLPKNKWPESGDPYLNQSTNSGRCSSKE